MRLKLLASALGIAVVGSVALSATPAQAWWGPYRYGWRPRVVVVGPPVYYAPPVAYVRPRPFWVAPYWYGGRHYPGYWR